MTDEDTTSKDTTIQLSGKRLSPGMGSGKAFLHRDVLDRLDEFYDIEDLEVEGELQRYTLAVAKVSDDLKALASQVSNEMDEDLSNVFLAHIAILQDPSLKAEVEQEIRAELVSAGTGVKSVFRRWELRFLRMEAEVARQKADDVHDLARRLVYSLAGVRGHALEEIPDGSVLVATRLLPSDTIYLARRNVSAALLEFGGIGSHAALFAREIGLPCVAGFPELLQRVSAEASILVDADAGEAIINPDQQQKDAFHAKDKQQQKTRKKALACAAEPAVTQDGTVIPVFANVASAVDTQQAIDSGADGVGLYRVEQAFLGMQEPPDAATLLNVVRETLEPARGLPVYVRLLDVGADKPLPFMGSFREVNPALGLRGIRFLQAYPDLLKTQLEVLLILSSEFNLHILVPMVTVPQDMQFVREWLQELASQSKISPVPKLGAMIETPGAALSLRHIAQYADFVSFGTNDLTQYTFAADRENAAVERFFDDTHEAIFRLLEIAHLDVPDIPFSVCGELAGRSEYVAKLLQCGVNTLSVAPPLIPAVKEAVRQCRGITA